MDKFRKVCSFLLVVSLVFSSLSVSSFAGEKQVTLTDIKGNTNAQAISVCQCLGIVTGNPDGTYLPDKQVTRAEFAAMLTRAIAIPESALKGYDSSRFKDANGYGWAVPYLGFCESKGIMLGDGKGNAMPGKAISLNEAITMALRAVGYTANSSLLTGTWPANYTTIAQNNDLYEDVADGAVVNRANAAQIIYNTLFVNKVSVGSDGKTDYLEDPSGEARTLLNTGLGCTMEEGVVEMTTYPDSLIPLVSYMGAYGEIYLNEDNEVVAVKPTVTRLSSGNFNAKGTRFDLTNGTHYDIEDTAFTSPSSVFILNSKRQYTITSCAAFAYRSATIYADVSGDEITKIYSVTRWSPDDAFKADGSIQEETSEDKTINGWKLPLNDEGEIDYTKLRVFGVPSLADIKKDNVIYIYKNHNSADDEVNYIEVGTLKVSGTITEFDDGSNDYYDLYYLNDKMIPAYKGTTSLDPGSTYDLYLDAWGCVYDADKTAGNADTYGIVQAATAQTSFDNYKVKLYTSEDATKTLYIAEEDPKDIDWTTTGATTIGAVTTGALIGYSLDSNGAIDAIDNTVKTTTSTSFKYKGSGVIGGFSVADNAVAFTYKTTIANSADYDVIKIADIDSDTVLTTSTLAAYYILNDDGDIAALFVEETLADVCTDAVYGVINKRATATTDGDDVYKFTGFIDGAAFTYKTDDQINTGVTGHTAFDNFAGKFGVYAITLDAGNTITRIKDMDPYAKGDSGYINAATEEVVKDLASGNTKITVANGSVWPVSDKAVVYKYDTEDKEFTVSKLSAIDKGDSVMLYDTEGSDSDGIADVVIYHEN